MARNQINDSLAAARKASAPAAGRKDYRVKDRSGLYLRVSSTGAKSWRFRRKLDGKIITKGLGPFVDNENELRRVYDRAAEMAGQVTAKIDPKAAEAERAVAEGETFEAVARDFVQAQREEIVESSIKRHQRYISAYIADTPLGRKPISDVTRRDLLDIVTPIRKTQREKAKAVASTFAGIFDYAIFEEHVDDSPAVQLIPRMGRGKKAKLRRRAENAKGARLLTEEEIGIVWEATGKLGYPLGSITRLHLLTGCRRNELRLLKWEDVGDDAIHLKETKNSSNFDLPLTSAMRGVLNGCLRGSDYVFSANGTAPLSTGHHWLDKLRGATNEVAGQTLESWSFNSLRKTSSTGMEALGIRSDIVELSHNRQSTLKTGVAKIYQKHNPSDDIAAAFEAWNARVMDLVDCQPEDSENF